MAKAYTAILKIAKEIFQTGICDATTHNEAMDRIDELFGSSLVWRDPVSTFAALPTGTSLGEARVVLDELKIYLWDGFNWTDSAAGAIIYQGTWDASTNTPTLSDATGVKGNYYVVSVGGSQDLGSGLIDFSPGDWAVHNGVIWQKADHTDTVTSVFGRQGAVVAVSDDYMASQITNNSGVTGAYVDDALDWLKAAPPNPHKDLHKFGGTDAFLATDLLDAVVRRLRETGGPTDLLIGSIPDAYILARAGSTIIGINPQAAKAWAGSFGDNTGPGSNSSSATPTVIRYKVFPGTNLWGAATGIKVVLGSSTSGRAVNAQLHNETSGIVIADLSTTLTGQNIVTLLAASFTNPLPTGEALMSIRIYRSGLASTCNIYDFVLY